MSSPKAPPTIIIGIPAFNVERTIARVASEVSKYCDLVLICDDGSTDKTALAAERAGCEVVKHSRNMGYGATIKTLLETARGKKADILVTIDGDGQHDPKEISELVKPIVEGNADLVIGSRFIGNGEESNSTPRMRKLGIRTITRLTDGLSRQKITDAQSGFRAYSRKAITLVNPGEQGMGASTEILLIAEEQGLRIREVPISVAYNIGKTSTLNPAFHFADVFGSTLKVVSIRHPLLAYGLPGIILLLSSLGFGVWAIQLYGSEGRLVTNIALISMGFAVIGTTLLITGLLLFVLITVIREKQF